VLALLAVVAVRLTGTERGALLVLLVGALPLTLCLAYPLLAVSAWLRSVPLVVACLTVVAAQVLLVIPSLSAVSLPDDVGAAPSLRVVVANLYVRNPDPRAAGQALRELDADVLVVPELDVRGRQGLRESGLLEDLPHVVESGPDGEVLGLFSRLPLSDVSLRRIGARVMPRATVEIEGVPVRVLAIHPLPPLGGLEPLWRVALADAAREAAAEDGPVVLAGDLNAGRHHAAFRDLLSAGLRDAHAERGRGLARTWPARLPLLHLDHVLVGDGDGADLAVLDVREEVLPGSDHRAVVTDLAVLAR
jgi:endonuclease/exonuclease/phosphatase (EEP) superfamily protein YafD